jgi:hypothetical protein
MGCLLRGVQGVGLIVSVLGRTLTTTSAVCGAQGRSQAEPEPDFGDCRVRSQGIHLGVGVG